MRDAFAAVFSNAAVLGAGVMGGGIAQLLAEKGLTVRMKDINTRAVGSRSEGSLGHFPQAAAEGHPDARSRRATGSTGSPRPRSIAVSAGRTLPSRLSSRTWTSRSPCCASSRRCGGSCAIFASNTSSLSITDLAEASSRPGAGRGHALLQSRGEDAARGGGARQENVRRRP